MKNKIILIALSPIIIIFAPFLIGLAIIFVGNKKAPGFPGAIHSE